MTLREQVAAALKCGPDQPYVDAVLVVVAERERAIRQDVAALMAERERGLRERIEALRDVPGAIGSNTEMIDLVLEVFDDES